MRISEKRFLLFIFIVALFLRLAFVVFYPQRDIVGDAIFYDTIAKNIAMGNGFALGAEQPITARTIVYPFFLGLIYSLFGHDLLAVRIIQSILAATLPVIVYLIAKETFGNKETSVIAACLCVVYPAFIIYAGLLVTETLFTLLLALTLLVLISSIKMKKSKLYICGFFVGLMALTRAEALLFPLIIFITLLFLKYNLIKSLKFTVVIGGILFLTILPWQIRNYLVLGKIHPTGGSLRMNLFGGVDSEGFLGFGIDKGNSRYNTLTGYQPSEFDERRVNKGIKIWIEEPGLYFKLYLKRFASLWIAGHSNNILGFEDSTVNYLKQRQFGKVGFKLTMLIVNLTIIFLGIIGLIKGILKSKLSILLVCVVVYFTAINTFLSIGDPRHQIPIMPYLIIFTADYINISIKKKENWTCSTK
jgi:4-amino-4-deoxy-L-arabinose transferase-like glycosyltransferase